MIILHILISSPGLFSEFYIFTSNFLSLFQSPFGSLKLNISKFGIFEFNINKNQGIDISPEM